MWIKNKYEPLEYSPGYHLLKHFIEVIVLFWWYSYPLWNTWFHPKIVRTAFNIKRSIDY